MFSALTSVVSVEYLNGFDTVIGVAAKDCLVMLQNLLYRVSEIDPVSRTDVAVLSIKSIEPLPHLSITSSPPSVLQPLFLLCFIPPLDSSKSTSSITFNGNTLQLVTSHDITLSGPSIFAFTLASIDSGGQGVGFYPSFKGVSGAVVVNSSFEAVAVHTEAVFKHHTDNQLSLKTISASRSQSSSLSQATSAQSSESSPTDTNEPQEARERKLSFHSADHEEKGSIGLFQILAFGHILQTLGMPGKCGFMYDGDESDEDEL